MRGWEKKWGRVCMYNPYRLVAYVHVVSGKVDYEWLLQAVTWLWITCIHICEGDILLVRRVPVQTRQNVIGCLEPCLDGESE